jgi:prepilin signal peptidase PulO-like enzyme (type II secretory pathway)
MILIPIVLAAAAFAVAAALGIAAARFVVADVEEMPNSPAPSTVPWRTLVIGSAVLGGIAAARGLNPGSLAFIALACGVLTAIWASDVSAGVIPDVFTLFPLAAIVLASLAAFIVHRLTGPGFVALIIAILVPAIPFAFVAWRSGGLSLGWGDVKLAALGGPLIGLQESLLAFSIGCAVAVAVARIRKTGNSAIAFGPYLAAAIAVPLAIVTQPR